jgi:hypothetical protein
MRNLKHFCLLLVGFSLLAIPAVAQKGKGDARSNKGAAATGDTRADLVQSGNKKKDKDKDPSKDNDKNKGKHKGETQGKHKAKGHSH